jgi:hypothetical protein
MASQIMKIESKNHEIVTCMSQSKTQANIMLKEDERCKVGKDFVLHFSDKLINEPAVFSSVNEHKE